MSIDGQNGKMSYNGLNLDTSTEWEELVRQLNNESNKSVNIGTPDTKLYSDLALAENEENRKKK